MKTGNRLKICVDFDGTCVKHKYPKVGEDIGAVPILKKLIENGHDLILFTMRDGSELGDAVNWFDTNDIELYGIQKNPEQHTWTTSPKAYGQLYIDDAALGCPLIYPKNLLDRPYVDWDKVKEYLLENHLI